MWNFLPTLKSEAVKKKTLCELNIWEWTDWGASLPVFWHGIGRSETSRYLLLQKQTKPKCELKPSPILAFPIFSPIQVPGLNSTLYLLQQPDMPAKNHPHIFPSTWGETCSPLSIQKAKQVVICEPKTWENKWLSCCTSDYSTQLVT